VFASRNFGVQAITNVRTNTPQTRWKLAWNDGQREDDVATAELPNNGDHK
jgi:hypothetical protein